MKVKQFTKHKSMSLIVLQQIRRFQLFSTHTNRTFCQKRLGLWLQQPRRIRSTILML